MFYGTHELHMQLQEILSMRFGEMLDLITCLAISNGGAKQIKEYSFMDAMELK